MNIFYIGDSLFTAMSLSPIDLSMILLLVKITLVITGALFARVLLRRYSAAVRHAVLVAALVAIPFVAVFHFTGPGWSLPEFASSFVKLESETAQETVLLPQLRIETDPLDVLPRLETDELIEPEPKVPVSTGGGSMVVDRSALQRSEVTTEQGKRAAFGPKYGVGTARRSDRGAISNHLPNWRTVLLASWLVGSTFLICRLVWSWRMMVRKVSGSAPLEIDENSCVSQVARRLLEHLARQKIDVRVVEGDSQLPCAFGLWRRTILLPEGCKNWEASRWQSVLLHESAHFRRHDCWTNLAGGVVQAVLWWHPLAGRLVQSLRIESELACDDQVLQSGVSRGEYADMLLEFAASTKGRVINSATAVGMAGSQAIESRIRSILSADTARDSLKWNSLTPLLAVAVIGVLPIAAARLSKPIIQSTVEANGPESSPVDFARSNTIEAGFASDQGDGLLPTPFDVRGKPGPVLVAEPIFQIKTGAITILGRGSFEYAISTSFGRVVVESDSLKQMEPIDLHAGEYRITAIDGREFTGKLNPNGGLRVSGWKLNEPNSIAELSMDYLKSNPAPGQIGSKKKAGGMMLCDGEPIWIRSIRNAPLVPGKISNGLSVSGLNWHLRTPEQYVSGQKYPVLVLLHGKSDNSENYIRKVVTMWPELAGRFLLVGINGEKRSEKSTTTIPRYDYTYFNFRGRSDFYSGLPESNRDSPVLVAETIADIRAYLPTEKIFLVGHSDGGYVASSVLMNYPETIDGAVIVAGGLPTPSGPTGYRDVELRRLQRERPVVFVSGEVVMNTSKPGPSQKAFHELRKDSFGKVHAINIPGAGDGFSTLPLDRGIEWVEDHLK